MSTGAERDRALATYDVIGGPPRRELTALVDLAAQVAGVPFATVNLLSSRHQHQVATAGFQGGTTPCDDAMCRQVVESGQPIMLDDASLDPRFADNPWTTGEIADVKYYGSHPLRTPDGVVIGTLCVFDSEAHQVTDEAARGLSLLADRVVDVLELELASRRLSEVNARLSTSNERLANFAGQVSHDLKNPLTSISLSLEALEMEVTDDYQVDTVARARRGVERMTDMIGNLLDFAAQGEAPGDELVDLATEIELALDDLAGRIDRSLVRVEPLPTVRGDASQLRSVLMNLIDNAAKFTLVGEQPEVEVASVSADGFHRIEVRDRGRGIPEEKTERVFAPLARLDKTVEGSGIGLATCRRIIEAHGGTMGVDPRDGGGSVFWFRLPAVS
ncbi:signal transduction histidine kinase [Nocardioides sp. BE266]|uniref:sensor histidine kinase n=1 Tax=Nocardioides sp. BE266 TaxID=2817725 RepID=UPI00286507DA|nr:GAF domain-containing sensor histidine kinase [Nocardioides sp. BE266]MDR7253673.1 signal transduction histidine kinase [Nocardioides sp. BE266]